MISFRVHRHARLHRLILPALALLGLFGSLARSQAQCGNLKDGKGPAANVPSFSTEPESFFPNTSIVGLWHAIYTTPDNKVFNDSFKTWHADGTEVESAWLSPGGGNVCMGIWRQKENRSIKLHHIGWLFDPTKPGTTANGYFTMDEIITIQPNGKAYSGNFTFIIWNLDGTPTTTKVQGAIEATRITL